jgi:RNA polymerase sigma-70 factor (ECF subfamily)
VAAPTPYAAADDVALTIAVARYDADAFAEVYRRHGGAVYALAMRLLWGNPGVAHEVVQEVFLRLWEHPDRFDRSRGSLRSFLLMDGHSRRVNRLRAEQRRRDGEERSARADAVGSYDVDLEAWDLDVGEEVRKVMETLGEASAVRSSSRTSAVTPIATSPRCSASPREPSRAASVPGSCG